MMAEAKYMSMVKETGMGKPGVRWRDSEGKYDRVRMSVWSSVYCLRIEMYRGNSAWTTSCWVE